MKRKWAALVAAAGLSAAALGDGVSVRLGWDHSVGKDVAGYRIYQGGASGSYTNVLTVGYTNTAVVTGLARGGGYYFAATAFDGVGLESEPSNEVFYRVGDGSGNRNETTFASLVVGN